MNLDSTKPAIIAHRGASRYAPENTLAAFRLALDQQADGIELDVHLSRDGHAVILHDSHLNRTTNGQGQVYETTLAELKALNAGNGENIPTLAEALALIRDRALINIELKGFTGHVESLPKKVVEEVSAAGLSETIVYSSFSVHLLTQLQQIQPEAKLGWLIPPGPAARFNLLFRPVLPLYSLHPYKSLVTTGLMRRAKRWGLKIFAYTVNDPVKTKKLFDLGIDGIITDDPAAARIIRDNWGTA